MIPNPKRRLKRAASLEETRRKIRNKLKNKKTKKTKRMLKTRIHLNQQALLLKLALRVSARHQIERLN